MSGPIIVVGTKARHQWMKAFTAVARRDRRTPSAKNLAVMLMLHFNGKTGQCNPGYELLAEEIGVSERQLMRAIKELEGAGWISRRHPGGHDYVEFDLLIPNSEVTRDVTPERLPEVTRNVTPRSSPVTDHVTRREVTPNAPRGDMEGHLGVTSDVPHKEQERTGKRTGASPPAPAAPPAPPKRAAQLVDRVVFNNGEETRALSALSLLTTTNSGNEEEPDYYTGDDDEEIPF
ncbi:helix-turn-helix domain-containing protein [Bradyrhizobium sp. 956_D2_N1_5]|uniref:helix-turn-helix domain-containing protein n=1 Tax=unclassified Bradyrhizobium TaxID=2631580 RepID=UPI003F24D518